jgi:hypothetical protein
MNGMTVISAGHWKVHPIMVSARCTFQFPDLLAKRICTLGGGQQVGHGRDRDGRWGCLKMSHETNHDQRVTSHELD